MTVIICLGTGTFWLAITIYQRTIRTSCLQLSTFALIAIASVRLRHGRRRESWSKFWHGGLSFKPCLLNGGRGATT